MKKKFIFIIVLAAPVFLSNLIAGEQTLVVKLKDGSENVQTLSNVQRITFNAGSNMSIALKSGGTASFTLAEIQKLLFSQSSGNDVDEIANDVVKSLSIYPNPVQDVLFVDGVEENAVIRIFNLKGEVFQTVIAKEEVVQLNVSTLPQGIYILQAGNQAVKFIKK